MARPVGDESHELSVIDRGAGLEPVECIADRMDHVDIAPLGMAADVVGLADPATLQHQRERTGVIINVQPIAHVLPRPVNRHRLAGKALDDGQGDQLFRELAWPVIVRAVRDEDRQPVGVAPRPHQMVGRRLGGRIGRARIVAGLLGEAAVVGQCAEHLVGGDVMKAEAVGGRAEPPPMRERGLEQHIGADHIGVDEIGRAVDRTIDMAFGGKMHHGVGRKVRKYAPDRALVADVRGAEPELAVAAHGIEGGEVAGISQLVDDEHLVTRVFQEVPHHRRPDKSRPTGDNDLHGNSSACPLPALPACGGG